MVSHYKCSLERGSKEDRGNVGDTQEPRKAQEKGQKEGKKKYCNSR